MAAVRSPSARPKAPRSRTCYFIESSANPLLLLCVVCCRTVPPLAISSANQVAGGASIITSRAMTQQLSPHLEPWYRGIVERSGGDVNKAAEEDKFHDIAFQK